MSDSINLDPIFISTEAVFVAVKEGTVIITMGADVIKRTIASKGYWIECKGAKGQDGVLERKWLSEALSAQDLKCNGSIDILGNTYIGLGHTAAATKHLSNNLDSYESIIKNKNYHTCKDIIVTSLISGVNMCQTISNDDAETFCGLCQQDGIDINAHKKHFKDVAIQIEQACYGAECMNKSLGRFTHFVEKRRRKIIQDLALKNGGVFLVDEITHVKFLADLMS